jgi:hypothetical protein
MNVDVEIYMNNMVKFFKSNPNDLLNLIPKGKEDEFYEKIRETATQNIDKGEDAPLTQKQIIDICVLLNGKPPKEKVVEEKKLESYMRMTNFGIIFLN